MDDRLLLVGITGALTAIMFGVTVYSILEKKSSFNIAFSATFTMLFFVFTNMSAMKRAMDYLLIGLGK